MCAACGRAFLRSDKPVPTIFYLLLIGIPRDIIATTYVKRKRRSKKELKRKCTFSCPPFQKRVQESGILPRVRGIRYNDRPLSVLKTKRAKLKKLANLAKYEEDKRMGKVVERKKGRR